MIQLLSDRPVCGAEFEVSESGVGYRHEVKVGNRRFYSNWMFINSDEQLRADIRDGLKWQRTWRWMSNAHPQDARLVLATPPDKNGERTFRGVEARRVSRLREMARTLDNHLATIPRIAKLPYELQSRDGFAEFCELTPSEDDGRSYFVHRSGAIWLSQIRLSQEQWITSIDRALKRNESTIAALTTPSDNNEGASVNPRFISSDVRREVWRRDQGRCVQCGSQERLEFDHIIPFSRGGSSTARNIQLLCEPCNRDKAVDIS